MSNLKRINECFEAVILGSEALFDGFWQTGEVALLLGESGSGKSILALQLADSLARGRTMPGFAMTDVRRRVLYVDSRSNEMAFIKRYSTQKRDGSLKTYSFSENLYRAEPPDDADLTVWLKDIIANERFDAVIIDGLSMIDGIKNNATTIRNLKKLAAVHNISMLLTAACGDLSGKDHNAISSVGRWSVLAELFDSVFCLMPESLDFKRLVQLRTTSGERVWQYVNAPRCRIERRDDALLMFEFDERFREVFDAEKLRRIVAVRRLKNQGKTFREIGSLMGFSRTMAWKLDRLCTPKMLADADREDAAKAAAEERVRKEAEDAELDKRVQEFDALKDLEDLDDFDDDAEMLERYGFDLSDDRVKTISPKFAQKVRPIYELPTGYDLYGKLIYVERRAKDADRPEVWYSEMQRNVFMKYTRQSFGVVNEVVRR